MAIIQTDEGEVFYKLEGHDITLFDCKCSAVDGWKTLFRVLRGQLDYILVNFDILQLTAHEYKFLGFYEVEPGLMRKNIQPTFQYDMEAIEYLKNKDKKLARVIEMIGPIEEEIIPDIYYNFVRSIVGQQISVYAQYAIMARLMNAMNHHITPEKVINYKDEELKSFGLSERKVVYIKTATEKVINGDIDFEKIHHMTDDEAIQYLTQLKGVGEWTAEMMLMFSYNRMDIFSYKDLAIIRGLRMIYRHKEVSRERFEKYRRRFSPYGSLASLYIWVISEQNIEGYSDPLSKKK